MFKELPAIFKPAIEASRYSDHPNHKMGAAIYYKNKFLSAGHNLVAKTHPIMVQLNSKKTTHAELAAILKIRHKQDLNGTTIAVYRANKQGELALARPCPVCRELLRLHGVKWIVYTTPHGYTKERL